MGCCTRSLGAVSLRGIPPEGNFLWLRRGGPSTHVASLCVLRGACCMLHVFSEQWLRGRFVRTVGHTMAPHRMALPRFSTEGIFFRPPRQNLGPACPHARGDMVRGV